ncbi:glycosyltransferase family 2 protein [Turicibacter sanguinis]|uniref:glycosyltransferase family 2 protein n=1 Tax=Turicibacter sanguinis TaxID=154288 RepID=UPI0010495F05|nr:glycosyltransferase [Turicibacter sanguinis]MCU7212133.1 glycosyltransferase [Turicibacter sanguinis]QJS18077.1 glycosyltransferase [Turicibacter sanguinis]
MNLECSKISIIVPIYNVEKYLSKCVDSILNQSFKDFELILVNDGSTDESGKICDAYSLKDKRIKVIHQSNKGVGSARNVGINCAIGEYIAFIDPDDYIHENMYEILYKASIKDEADIVICNFYLVDEQTEMLLDSKPSIKGIFDSIQSGIDCLKDFYRLDDYYILPWNKLYKKNLFNNIYFPEGLIYEDEYIAHKLFFKSKNVVCLKECYYYYLQRKSSILGSSSNIKKADKILAKLDRIKFYKEHNLINLMYRANKDFVDLYFWSYECIQKEVGYNHEKLKEMRKLYRKNFRLFSQGVYISFNHKLILGLFYVSPRLYSKVRKFV